MKPLDEYPTPLTDASGIWISVAFARDLERKLAICRDALKAISKYHVMQSHDAGKCVKEDVIDKLLEALELTK